jgi:hypothetical protein
MAESESLQKTWRMPFTCWLRKATETHAHGNNIYANAPECYTLRILPLIFVLQSPCLTRKNVI